MSLLDKYEERLESIQKANPGPHPIIEFLVRSYLVNWLQNAARENAVGVPDLIGLAVGYAGHRQLAQEVGVQMVLMDSRGRPYELPVPQPDINFSEAVIKVRTFLLPHTWSLLDWMRRERRVDDNTAVHEGIRILGALAAAADMTLRVCEPENPDSIQLNPLFIIGPLPPPQEQG